MGQKKRDKTKRSVEIHNTSNGGINIPDIKMYIKALNLTWLRKLPPPQKKKQTPTTNKQKNKKTNNPMWRKLLQATCPEIDSVKTYGPSMLTARKVNPFWINAFQAYETSLTGFI